MRKVIVTLSISLACVVHSFGQGNAPVGVVALPNTENTYIQTHEVTVADWNVYLNDIAKRTEENSTLYQLNLPDAAICQKVYKTDNYLTDANVQHYPIVGITLEQAKWYCSWRTDWENKNKKKANSSIYMYSLPTETDFQNAYDVQKTKTSVNLISAVNYKGKELTGIADNVNEMTVNKKVVVGAASNGLRFDNYTEAGVMLGFRCKVVVK
jgi:formylglycine-generating enzyme required for sulfatase activity